MVGTPAHDGRVDVRYADSLVNTIKVCAHYDADVIPVYLSYDALVQRARNDLVRLAVESDVADLVFIDSDQVWSPTAFLRLLAHDVDVVGLAVRKKDDEETYNVKVRDGNIPIDTNTGLWMPESVGTGFLRLSRAAFTALWDNSTEYEDNGRTSRLVFNVGVIDGKLWGEDTVMTAKLSRLGFQTFLDPAFTVSHVGVKMYEGGNFQEWVERHGPEQD
jgi:hypothetical protein